ncbi:MAG TPA: phosphoenolpyruvate--protein phosphotransferase [Gemmatimonadaceae bacterium]
MTLLAPLSGVIVPLERVPDPAFAQGLAGGGIAIEPLSAQVVAPCAGRVVQVHRAHHAVVIAASSLEILIHVGLDTVRLRGEGFTPLVKAGDDVRAGDPLLSFDADAVSRRARSLLTEILSTNMDRVASIEPRSGRVTAGRDVLMRVTIAGPGGGERSAATGEEVVVESAPIAIAGAAGLHARPAAVLVAAARRFAADVRLVKGTRDANVRSVVSILALEVGSGDMVTLVGRGADAAAAVSELEALLRTDLDAPVGAATGAYAPPRPATTVPPRSDGGGVLHGVPASPGVAVGQIFQFRHDDVVLEERATDPNHERRSLDAAIAAAHLQLEALQARVSGGDAEQAAIFAAHQELLEDPEVLDRAAADIRAGATAAFAWRQAYTAQADRLFALKNQLLAGRAADLRDVGRRVLHALVGQDGAPPELPPDSIVVAEELAPSDAASLDRSRLRGFCTTMGSATSHASILARGLGIPAVAGIDPRALALAPGTRVVLDGDAGMLNLAPTADEEAAVARRQAETQRRRRAELESAGRPATTRDSHRVEVVANIGEVSEARRLTEVGGEGVGLLRTEFLFMERHEAPDADEQTRTYEAIARALGPDRILVIRTLDVGGDKPLSYLPIGAEANPFLGERGVRLTLNRPELFRTQIRAILRASHAGKVAMMFPMVATLAEWRAARALVEQERELLGAPPIQVGIMVETAAAALITDRFAREGADFFSIGTNDLTQYALAMDRSNPRLATQVDTLHPAVLQLIQRTVAGAHAHGRWVGVCGALAGDLVAVPVLVGLGVDELSVDVPIVPAVKARIRELSYAECRTTAQEALEIGEGAEVRALVARRHSFIET